MQGIYFTLVCLLTLLSHAKGNTPTTPVWEAGVADWNITDPTILNDPALAVLANEELVYSRKQQTSFHTAATHISFAHHCDFLDHQTRLFWPAIQDAMDAAGVVDGMHILDFGGGPGPLGALIAMKYPNSVVTVLDIDHTFLSYGARRYADLVRSGRLRFLHASAVNTTLPDESVDFIVSQFVFQHLYHPRAAVAEAHRVLRIGGSLLVVDVDENVFDVVYPVPPTTAFGGKMNRLHASRHAMGLDSGHLFRWMSQLMQAYSFEHHGMRLTHASSHEMGKEHFLPLLAPSQFYALVRFGLISEQTFSELEKRFGEYVNSTQETFLMVSFTGLWSGKKTLPHSKAVESASQVWIPTLWDFERRIDEGLAAQREKRAPREFPEKFFYQVDDDEDDDGYARVYTYVQGKDDPLLKCIDDELDRAKKATNPSPSTTVTPHDIALKTNRAKWDDLIEQKRKEREAASSYPASSTSSFPPRPLPSFAPLPLVTSPAAQEAKLTVLPPLPPSVPTSKSHLDSLHVAEDEKQDQSSQEKKRNNEDKDLDSFSEADLMSMILSLAKEDVTGDPSTQSASLAQGISTQPSAKVEL